MSGRPNERLAEPGHPTVEWVEGENLARWVFASADAVIQLHEFRQWCKHYGYDARGRPEKIEGNVWFIRRTSSSSR